MILKSHTDEALMLMATTDRLTGATNRHAFLDAAIAVYKNCFHLKCPVSLLFMDIDHFKQINDEFGHGFGDTVLTRFAALIDKCLRDSDLSCRYGGEEFVVLLANADTLAAKKVADRIMNEVRLSRFDEKPDFTFSVSIGVSWGVPISDSGFQEAIRVADEAMYRAKRSGRDRVVITSV
jgi:diguanylate cyclase (GGDEF)-like protein